MARTTRIGSAATFGLLLVCLAVFLFPACVTEKGAPPVRSPQVSDHFDGTAFFNPVPSSPTDTRARRGSAWWIWRWVFGTDFPEWPEEVEVATAPRPAAHAPEGTLRVIAVGHSTFLIQMDGINILTDPIWSQRCSPVSWAGPKRRQKPGLDFDDLPPLDAVLVSHNHYDHLDLPTLRRLAGRGVSRAVVPLGNRDLVGSTGIPRVEELDWWQSIRISPRVTVTLVPAQHFSSRTLWDRNKTLWGGFVVSGPSGNLYYAGDTGYGPHFREIARRFAPIRVALLPIAPFRPAQLKNIPPPFPVSVHMGPEEAVRAHLDLGAEKSIAAHYRVFQLGWDGFDEAVNGLSLSRASWKVDPDDFVALSPGEGTDISGRSTTARTASAAPARALAP